MPNMFYKAKDPISSYTHFIGAVFSIFATFLMVSLYFLGNNSSTLILSSVLLFGLSLIALYSASSIYHYINGSKSLMIRLRKLDHAMIYVLIAGSYTPICAKFLPQPNGLIFIISIWTIAIIGILVKVLWLNAPRWLYTSLYLLMGWSLMFDFDSFKVVPFNCLFLIALGGISYTIGAFVYIFKKPGFCKSFGFHEIFHVLIMIGSLFHIISVIIFVL